MKISRFFLDFDKIQAAKEGNLPLNQSVGFAYDDDEKGTSCPIFLGTDRDTGELKRIGKDGHLQLNARTSYARKKGDHQANTPAAEVSAEAQPAQEEAQPSQELTPEQQQQEWNEKLRAQIPL